MWPSDDLVARVSAHQLPLVEVKRQIIWVVLASLAQGGAERIVLDWLRDATAHGYEVRLAVQMSLPHEWAVPESVVVLRREGSQERFMHAVARRAQEDGAKVCTHLVRDEHLEILWAAGLAVIPTVHNAKAGWRNDPVLWGRRKVPFVIAVSTSVSDELKAHACAVPIVVIRHKPKVSLQVFSIDQRRAIRARYRVGQDELFIGMIGSLKAQKNYKRALEVLHSLRSKRPAKLLIAGGYQDEIGKQLLLDLCKEGARRGLAGLVCLPGFIEVESLMPAFDVLLNTSDFEGFSMATQEALLSGLPVIASDVGGQAETIQPGLTLVPAHDLGGFVRALEGVRVRNALHPPGAKSLLSTSRLWTLAAIAPAHQRHAEKVLFITANLNAGGAQRSLVNLAVALVGRLEFEVAVTGASTSRYFADQLAAAEVNAFRACASRNVLDIAETLLTYMSNNAFRTVVFWNVDPKLKLLLVKFLPSHRIIDVSPGHYAFLEMDDTVPFQKELAFTSTQLYAALDAMVLKFRSDAVPSELMSKLRYIPNGVPAPTDTPPAGTHRLVVQGRIAQSKQLDVILAAMPLVRQQLQCELHIYGQAEERSASVLDALLAQAEPMKEYVFFHGAKPDLAASLGEFDAAIVLGRHQGCPNAVLEALAAGVPVVANDSGGTRELVISGETGLLLPEQLTAETLATAVLHLFDLDRATLRARALEHARQFTMAAMCMRYLNLLEERENDDDLTAEIQIQRNDLQADRSAHQREVRLSGC